MIKGLAITPPILGRISIGKVVEKNGKRLPEKDDQFTITTQVQNKDGWINHPFDEELRKGQANNKIRSIPIRLLFSEPDLNLRGEYSLFDRTTGRPMCVDNGESCRRFTASGIESMPCPSPDSCELAKAGCKPFGRLNVQIGDEEDLGTFIFRTTGSFGHNHEFVQSEKEDQEIAESCRRLIKNVIICWNYLFLARALEQETDPVRKAQIIEAIRNGSVATWRHFNLHGEFDFSDEKMIGSIGLLLGALRRVQENPPPSKS